MNTETYTVYINKIKAPPHAFFLQSLRLFRCLSSSPFRFVLVLGSSLTGVTSTLWKMYRSWAFTSFSVWVYITPNRPGKFYAPEENFFLGRFSPNQIQTRVTGPLLFFIDLVPDKDTERPLLSSVTDPHHIDADPDPTCNCDANPDPACYFDADPDPTFHSDADPEACFQKKGAYLIKVLK